MSTDDVHSKATTPTFTPDVVHLSAKQVDLYSQTISPEGEHPLLPQYGWRARFDWWPEIKCKPFSWPRWSQLPEIFVMSCNYMTRFYFQKLWGEGRRPFIDGMRQVKWEPIYGVPIGGIGAGSIGRGFRGEFCRFQLIPGMVYHETAPFSQWLVTVRRRGGTVLQQVLSVHAEPQTGGKFRSAFSSTWSWSFSTEEGAYVGLYPRGYYLYRLPSAQVVLMCEQMSPVLPHDYEDSCLPVSTYHWTVVNLSPEECEVSITLVWQASFGTQEHPVVPGHMWSEEAPPLHMNEGGNDALLRICLLHQPCQRMACTFGLAAVESDQTRVSIAPRFHPTCDAKKLNTSISNKSTSAPCWSADDVWRSLIETGNLSALTSSHLPSSSGKEKKVANGGEKSTNGVTSHSSLPPISQNMEYLSAVSVQCRVPGHSMVQRIKFLLVWHSPLVSFRSQEVAYRRRYNRWFSEDPRQGVVELMKHSLLRWSDWLQRLESWQQPILNNMSLPDWYKSALFNELYFVADGGTVWLDPLNFSLNEDLDAIPVKKEIGYFAYLEGHEYRMFNTYDVHYYASWALIKLWPKLQLALQYDVGYCTKMHDPTPVYVVHTNSSVERSRPRCVPHDLGDPEDEPWRRINAYVMYDTNEWKDLNCKFLLQVYRDWVVAGDRDYLEWMVPICEDVVRRSLEWDVDGDGIIDNGGYADQTYDAWTVTGASAYTGGLWLAGLYATCRMMEEVGRDCSEFKDVLTKAKDNFVKKLWNGRYFLYDRSNNRHHRAIMSDQLNGHWYLKSCGVFDNALFHEDHIHRALKTIFEHNVTQVGLGTTVSTGWKRPASHNGKNGNTSTSPEEDPTCRGNIGAVNGMMPEHGQRDISSVHAEEFWVGVNYSLAALYIMEGYEEEGFHVARGCYETVWRRFGLQFQGPEAYFDDGRFRSLGYMRPLCVWSIQHALEIKAKREQAVVEKCAAIVTAITNHNDSLLQEEIEN